MQRCRISFSISGSIKIPVQEEIEDAVEEIVDHLEDGTPPRWVESLIIEAVIKQIQAGEIEIDDTEMESEEFGPEDELVFE